MIPNTPNQHPAYQITTIRTIIGFLICTILVVPVAYIGIHSMDASATVKQAPVMMNIEINVESIVSGLDMLVDIQHAGDERLFIMEKSGRILILDASRALLDTAFLDIQNQVASGGERGLLGLAFHPDYATNGYFYVNYTINSPDRTRISRFTVSADNGNVADSTSEMVLMEFGQPFNNHNGGQLQFGSDGYLYIATGDGGSGGDPNNAGQTHTQLLGKILRIDVDGTSSGAPECDPNGVYTIPASNPYIGTTDTPGTASNCDEIWATGLRNPWRFSFDEATDDMWISDVGQGSFEEINFQPASSGGGENYGWRCFEGNAGFDSSNCQSASAYVAPVHDYGRDDGCSVTGGLVYRGSTYPALVGHYIFADYCTGNYWTLSGDPSAPTLATVNTTGDSARSPAAFGTDLQGELYVASRGSIFHLQNPNPVAEPTGTPTSPTSPVPAGDFRSYLPMIYQN